MKKKKLLVFCKHKTQKYDPVLKYNKFCLDFLKKKKQKTNPTCSSASRQCTSCDFKNFFLQASNKHVNSKGFNPLIQRAYETYVSYVQIPM